MGTCQFHPNDIATTVLRRGAVRLLDVLAEAGGGPARPSDLGESAGVGHTSRAAGLGELRRMGLVDGTIHAVSLTDRGWAIARQRREGGAEGDPQPVEPGPVAATDRAPTEDSIMVVEAVASAPEAVYAAPSSPSDEDVASNGWAGWAIVLGVAAVGCWWFRSRGGASVSATGPMLEGGLAPPQGAPVAGPVPPTGPAWVPRHVARLHQQHDGLGL